MGVAWAILGSSWADSGLPWQPHGLSWSYIGGISGRLGRSETQTGENLNICQKRKENQCLLPLGALLEGLLGASWGFLGHLGRSWEALGPSDAFGDRLGRLYGPSWCPLGALWGRLWTLLGASWAILGSSWADLGPSWWLHGLSWGYLGGLLSCLGRSVTQTGENLKIIQNLMKINVPS